MKSSLQGTSTMLQMWWTAFLEQVHKEQKVTLTASSRTTRKAIIPTSIIETITIVVNLPQVLYPSRYHSKLSQVMIYHEVPAQ